MENGQFPFVGRHDALNAFHGLLSARAQKNVLYVEAPGGLGKTRLLREYINTCQKKRHWHVAPPDIEIDPLIDFFELTNRSVTGLRHSIIDRLGWQYFASFKACEDELAAVDVALGTDTGNDANSSVATAVALRRRRDELFFHNLRRALRGRQVVLFFDTFEVVSRRRVGRWLLKEFLAETEACLMVIAGRPPKPPLPSKVQVYELKPWTETEVTEYFQKRDWSVSTDESLDLRRITGGHPLLLDMTIYLRNSGILALDNVPSTSVDRTERALIDRLIRGDRPEHQVIQEMAFLKRRYDPRIFALRQSKDDLEGIPDYASLCAILMDSDLRSIVKYRPKSQVLTLHDEVQRMIEEHAPSSDRPSWKGLCDELYNDVIKNWYPTAIELTESREEQNLLKAEQLGYEIEYDTERGLNIYLEYFEQIKKDHLFDFNELIWDVIQEQMEAGFLSGKEYELCYAQADWLWFVNQFDTSADLYSLIIDRYTPGPSDVVRRLEALASLGHALMQIGKLGQAMGAFEDGLSLSTEAHNLVWLSAFQQNKGQLLLQLSLWIEAEEWLQAAVRTAQATQDREALALTRINLGRVQALLGKYREAILNSEIALALRHDILLHPDRQGSMSSGTHDLYYEPVMAQSEGYFSEVGRKARVGIAHLWLAQAYRYSGASNRTKARRNYKYALAYLPPTSEYSFISEAWQGLANTCFDEGIDLQRHGDLIASIASLAEAFDLMSTAIALNREKGPEQHLPKALHRLAHVVFAVGQLEHLDALRDSEILRELTNKVSSFMLPEENPWLRETVRLREHRPFRALDTVAKAQRLFEISSLKAELHEDFNTSLDSLIQAGEIALYRGRPEDVLAYAELAQVPSRAYPQELFLALTELLLADLDLSEGRTFQALKRYSSNFPMIAGSGGYGRYLLDDQLERLGQRLGAMPSEQAIQWCNSLLEEWTAEGLNESYPEMVAKIWEYRNLFMLTN